MDENISKKLLSIFLKIVLLYETVKTISLILDY